MPRGTDILMLQEKSPSVKHKRDPDDVNDIRYSKNGNKTDRLLAPFSFELLIFDKLESVWTQDQEPDMLLLFCSGDTIVMPKLGYMYVYVHSLF